MPSSKRARVATFTSLVSGSQHIIFLVVLGRKPRKMPLRVMAKLSRAVSRRSDMHATTKCTKSREVILFSSSNLQGRLGLIGGVEGVLDTKEVMKSMRPKLGFQINPNKTSSNGIGHGEMSLFHGTILMRGISACRTNGVTVEEVARITTANAVNVFQRPDCRTID